MWILEKTGRRSSLVAVETAIRTDRLEHRPELLAILRLTMQLPDIAPRELARMITIARLLADADLLVELRTVEAIIGRPPRRPPRK
jgi:hypothetical protein